MRKGEQTRQEILHKVAVLFNEKGYTTTSMQDITAVTGVQRGGIYNHFASKEDLALETFDYACTLLAKRLMQRTQHQPTSIAKLKAIASGFAEVYINSSVFPCGCPVLNTAVEAKRQMLSLRKKALTAMNQLKALIQETVTQGIENSEFSTAVDSEAIASVFIAVLEGAMLLSVLYDDSTHLEHGVNHLHWYLDTLAI